MASLIEYMVISVVRSIKPHKAHIISFLQAICLSLEGLLGSLSLRLLHNYTTTFCISEIFSGFIKRFSQGDYFEIQISQLFYVTH
jgi:hypothetical protein